MYLWIDLILRAQEGQLFAAIYGMTHESVDIQDYLQDFVRVCAYRRLLQRADTISIQQFADTEDRTNYKEITDSVQAMELRRNRGYWASIRR